MNKKEQKLIEEQDGLLKELVISLNDINEGRLKLFNTK